MIYLFIHQNFPGQYRHIVEHLAAQREHSVYFISQHNQVSIPRVTKLVYKAPQREAQGVHPFSAWFDYAVRNGMEVARICEDLKGQGVRPDIIAGHAGWGETMFVKDVFTDVPVLGYFEFYYHFSGVDFGFDPEFDSPPQDAFRLRTRNAVTLMSFDSCDWGNTPTNWQRSLHPPEMRPRLTRIHEGVDVKRVAPNPAAWLRLERAAVTVTRKDEVITYVARNLEPYRGFHIFMRALPEILRRRPRARVLIIGEEGVSYGAPAPQGTTYKQQMLDEVGPELDNDRVHFLGAAPYSVYLEVLRVSSVHVYLTYPFILSWSFIEAMACGCAIVGSATPPVQEVLQDGVNGLLVDFFATDALCDRVDEILDHPDRRQDLRDAARATAVKDFDFESRLLPRWLTLMDDLVNQRVPALDASTAGGSVA